MQWRSSVSLQMCVLKKAELSCRAMCLWVVVIDSTLRLSCVMLCRVRYCFTNSLSLCLSVCLSVCPMPGLYVKANEHASYTLLTFWYGHHSSFFVAPRHYKIPRGTPKHKGWEIFFADIAIYLENGTR